MDRHYPINNQRRGQVCVRVCFPLPATPSPPRLPLFLFLKKRSKKPSFLLSKYEDINGFIFILRSNEPDHPQQANLTPSQAAQVYQKYMMPLKGLGASIATPAVTNGGAPMGLTYLESFVSHCSGCSFDVINIHHYVQRSDCNVDQAVAAFKTYLDETLVTVQNKYTQLSGLPVCIGEVRVVFFGGGFFGRGAGLCCSCKNL